VTAPRLLPVLLVLCLASCRDPDRGEPRFGDVRNPADAPPPAPAASGASAAAAPTVIPATPAPAGPAAEDRDASLPEEIRVRLAARSIQDPGDGDLLLLLSAGLDALAAAAPGAAREELVLRLVRARHLRAPASALSMVLDLPPATREDALGMLLPLLAPDLEPEQVPGLVDRSGLSRLARRRLLDRCVQELAATFPRTALACHGALGERGDRTALRLARTIARDHRAEALTWVAAIQDAELRDEGLAEVLVASCCREDTGAGDPFEGLDGVRDPARRDWARGRILLRLAAVRPQEALALADTVQDSWGRDEVSAAAAWGFLAVNAPEPARTAAAALDRTAAWETLRERLDRQDPARRPPTPEAGGDPCRAAAGDPILTPRCRAAEVEELILRGGRDAALEQVQQIAAPGPRAAAWAACAREREPGEIRAMLRRARTLAAGLPDTERDRYVLAMLRAAALPPEALLRDALARIGDAALRREVLTSEGRRLSPVAARQALVLLGDPLERALLCVTVLEAASAP